MWTFIFIVFAIVAISYFVKQNKKKQEQQKFDEQKAFQKEALAKIEREHNIVKSTEKNFFDRSNIYKEMIIGIEAGKFAVVDSKNRTLDVYEGKEIISVELKENAAATIRENHGTLYSGTARSSSYVDELILLVVMEKGSSISFQMYKNYFFSDPAKGAKDYPSWYAHALQLKSYLESLKGNNQSDKSVNNSGNLTEEIQKLQSMMEQGILDETEFKKAKEKILAS